MSDSNAAAAADADSLTAVLSNADSNTAAVADSNALTVVALAHASVDAKANPAAFRVDADADATLRIKIYVCVTATDSQSRTILVRQPQLQAILLSNAERWWLNGRLNCWLDAGAALRVCHLITVEVANDVSEVESRRLIIGVC